MICHLKKFLILNDLFDLIKLDGSIRKKIYFLGENNTELSEIKVISKFKWGILQSIIFQTFQTKCPSSKIIIKMLFQNAHKD